MTKALVSLLPLLKIAGIELNKKSRTSKLLLRREIATSNILKVLM
ncbi:hypothetical protein [Altericista sp. CCNU0014]